MDRIKTIIGNLSVGKPFALARFNDGEMSGIVTPGVIVARGDQYIHPSLTIKLRKALLHRQSDYWIGLPCSTCWPQHAAVAESSIDRRDYPYFTSAVVLTNRNFAEFVSSFSRICSIRQPDIVWVSGDDQDMSKLDSDLGIKVSSQFKFQRRDSWAFYPEMFKLHNQFKPGQIVVLSCGPTSRVLSQEWFAIHPDITFLDAGSVFDPWTRNVYLRCHYPLFPERTSVLPACKECN